MHAERFERILDGVVCRQIVRCRHTDFSWVKLAEPDGARVAKLDTGHAKSSATAAAFFNHRWKDVLIEDSLLFWAEWLVWLCEFLPDDPSFDFTSKIQLALHRNPLLLITKQPRCIGKFPYPRFLLLFFYSSCLLSVWTSR
jgi:hypothetical protein